LITNSVVDVAVVSVVDVVIVVAVVFGTQRKRWRSGLQQL